MSRPVYVRAWLLAEGDVLAGGKTVIFVQRDPVTGRVEVATDDGRRRVLIRDDRLVAVNRLAADIKPRNGGVRAFLGGVRRDRHDRPDDVPGLSRAIGGSRFTP